MSHQTISQSEIEAIKDSLRRCSAETIDAAIRFRETGDASLVPAVVTGIIERFLEPDMKSKIREGDDTLSLFDDLGVDSLTMMEIVILVEETLAISVENEELRDLSSIGDVKSFIHRKLGVADQAQEGSDAQYPIGLENILEVMPQQPPFLFIEQASVSSQVAKGTYRVSGSEDFLKGHFKGRPVFPASILLEALGQLAVLHLLKADEADLQGTVNSESVYFTSCDGIRCHKMVTPGDTLDMEVKLKRIRHPMASFEGTIMVGGERAVFAEELTLLFDYISQS